MKSRGGYIPFADSLGSLFIHTRRAVEKIRAQVSGWARLGNMAAFMKQNEIENGIEECRRELAACTNRFMVRQAYAT